MRADEHVRVECRADPARTGLLRAVTANLLVGLEFDIDAGADLKMAVDEAAAALVSTATEDAGLTADFYLASETFRVRISAPAGSDRDPLDRAGFSWVVLSTLSDSVDCGIEHPADGGSPLAFIELTKGRQKVHPGGDNDAVD